MPIYRNIPILTNTNIICFGDNGKQSINPTGAGNGGNCGFISLTFDGSYNNHEFSVLSYTDGSNNFGQGGQYSTSNVDVGGIGGNGVLIWDNSDNKLIAMIGGGGGSGGSGAGTDVGTRGGDGGDGGNTNTSPNLSVSSYKIFYGTNATGSVDSSGVSISSGGFGGTEVSGNAGSAFGTAAGAGGNPDLSGQDSSSTDGGIGGIATDFSGNTLSSQLAGGGGGGGGTGAGSGGGGGGGYCGGGGGTGGDNTEFPSAPSPGGGGGGGGSTIVIDDVDINYINSSSLTNILLINYTNIVTNYKINGVELANFLGNKIYPL